MESMITSLIWREATKQFDTEKKLSDEQLNTLLEAARLSPSSYGLQPWNFIVVTDPELRAKLREASWDQPQVTDASHLFVFTATTPDDALIDAYLDDIAATRGVTRESLEEFSQTLLGALAGKNQEERLAWAKKQVYLALGVTIATAASMHIDSCPMEGFDAAQYDEILGLGERDLHTAVILAVGFRKNDNSMKKVRFPKEKVITLK